MNEQNAEILCHRDGSIATVTINRPHRLNAFTLDTLRTTAAMIDTVAADPEVRVIVLTGAGRAFSAGADIADGDPVGAATVDAANEVTRAIRRAPQPVVAAVNGPAVGVGCSFALAADIIVARTSAYFLLAFADIGLMPDGGASVLIPAAVGRVHAMRMALLPDRIPAPAALAQGMITAVVDDADFDTEINRVTTRLAAGSAAAQARIKHAINASTLTGLADGLELERIGQTILLAGADYAEGVAAFQDKRPPRFGTG
ncbi:enoyl-CoA hydratase [Nocardia sp. NPDC058497]|uniref:enoyl-CoA hydratase n=1 Tax=Nocardia sp. NPDC058497 TaxID=3346529 RepID=UPI003654B3C1